MSDIMHQCFMAGKRGQELKKVKSPPNNLAFAHLLGIATRELGKSPLIMISGPAAQIKKGWVSVKASSASFTISWRGANFENGRKGVQTFFDVIVSSPVKDGVLKGPFRMDWRTDDPSFPKTPRFIGKNPNAAAHYLGLIARRYSPV